MSLLVFFPYYKYTTLIGEDPERLTVDFEPSSDTDEDLQTVPKMPFDVSKRLEEYRERSVVWRQNQRKTREEFLEDHMILPSSQTTTTPRIRSASRKQPRLYRKTLKAAVRELTAEQQQFFIKYVQNIDSSLLAKRIKDGQETWVLETKGIKDIAIYKTLLNYLETLKKKK